MLTTDQFNYLLPSELIAQKPAVPRDSSRLMVVRRDTGSIEHYHFHELPSLLSDAHVLVRNNTKVIPFRLFGEKSSGGKIEVLLLKRVQISTTPSTHSSTQTQPEVWEVLSKPGLKIGQQITLGDDCITGMCQSESGYTRRLALSVNKQRLRQLQQQRSTPAETPTTSVTDQENDHSLIWEALDAIGTTPLPPYITAWGADDEPAVRELYQTVYASLSGSAAAPTAGLHFTPRLFDQLSSQGVQIVDTTLHVGLGTFLPVNVTSVLNHKMHSEEYVFSSSASQLLSSARTSGKKIVAVGTTSARLLETVGPELAPQQGATELFIYPPRKFSVVDALITNFHQPKSTLLMLVTAFASYPNCEDRFTSFAESIMGRAYQTAIDEKYRFHSFGDAMLIL